MAQTNRRVLLPVDDSAECQRACDWLVQNFLRQSDEVHFLHVVPKMHASGLYAAPPVDYEPPAQDVTQAAIQHAEEFIKAHFLSKLPGGCPDPIIHIVKSETDTDSIGHVVCKRARELDVAAVAVAPHSKTRLQEFFLGSVASYLVHHCSKPVIVAH